MDILAVDWNSTIVENNADLSFNQFLTKINKVIDQYMPLKKMSNREYKRRFKPWITNGILNSISRKNKLYNKYSKLKDEVKKKLVHDEYKILKNNISELIRKSKKIYYESFFNEHNRKMRKRLKK